jgi:hypothetical protein
VDFHGERLETLGNVGLPLLDVVALRETMRLMQKVDELIVSWPIE